jgi:hypothetical protein
MSMPMRVCRKCGTSSWAYAERCVCGERRWTVYFKCIHPEEGEVSVPSDDRSGRLTAVPKGNGMVLLVHADPETGTWEKITKPFDDTLVKEVGWFVVDEENWEREIPTSEFPSPPEEYVEAARPSSLMVPLTETRSTTPSMTKTKKSTKLKHGRGRIRKLALGFYYASLTEGKEPSAKAIAAEIGCNVANVHRIIKPLEDTRREGAKRGAQERHRGRGGSQ